MAYDIGPIDGGGRTGASRLLALASHLETVRDEDYDHHCWRKRRNDGSWVMCALGHAVSALPEVIGLRWRHPDCDEVVRLDGGGITQNTLMLAAEAFELSLEEATAIFGIGPRTVSLYGGIEATRMKPRLVAAVIRELALAKMASSIRPVRAA